MVKKLTRRSIIIYLIYVLIACLAAAGGYACGIVFRQYLKIANLLILAAGLIVVLLIWNREIPENRKRKRITARIITIAVILLVILGLLFHLFMGMDKESVTEKDGEKKIVVERSWIMFLERSYYDYKTPFWYAKEPHCTETYDDGDPDRLLYTEYYSEDGVFTERVWHAVQEN